MCDNKGVIILKENVARSEVFYDPEDRSVIRNEESLMEIFKKSGLDIVDIICEADYPKELVPVKTYILQ